MTINQLRYFQVLARTEHYGQASEQLSIAQPSLSRAIALLEEELGVALFEKQGRNVALTRAGREFLQYIDQGIAQVDLGVSAMQKFGQRSQSIAIGVITPFLGENEFRTRLWDEVFASGKFRPDTTVSETESLLSELKRCHYDVVFCSYTPAETEIVFIPVVELPFVVAMQREDPLSKFDVIYPKQLIGRNMYLNTDPVYAALIQHIFDYYGIDPIVGGTSNEDLVLLHMVARQGGLFIGTSHLEMYRGSTILRPLSQDKFHRYVYLAYMPGFVRNQGVQKLIDLAHSAALTEEGLQPHAGERA